jgi:hypothetical protein
MFLSINKRSKSDIRITKVYFANDPFHLEQKDIFQTHLLILEEDLMKMTKRSNLIKISETPVQLFVILNNCSTERPNLG